MIKESKLNYYDSTYFPLEVLKYSKIIYPSRSIELNVKLNSNVNYYSPFYLLTDSINTNINKKNYFNNSYELKSFLSKIMLLPSLYLQAKLEHGVQKKHSFDLAKKDFNASSWECIKTSSKIRLRWKYKINWLQKQFSKSNSNLIRTIFKRLLAPKIDPNIKLHLTNEFIISLNNLINQMKINLNKFKKI